MSAIRLDRVDVSYAAGRRDRRPVEALSALSLEVELGQRVALVGRSGTGKSTIARLVTGLVRPSSGTVEVLGEDLQSCTGPALRRLRRRMHLVFQDPYDSLHPGMKVCDLVSEPLAIGGMGRAERRHRAAEALADLGLRPVEPFLDRYPGSLSGGQRQRVAIARTLVAQPELIVADEPASMLDASLRVAVAAQILEVRERLGATLVFITHDLALARHAAEQIVVLSNGTVIEAGPTERVLNQPAHAETRLLLDAARSLDPRPQTALG